MLLKLEKAEKLQGWMNFHAEHHQFRKSSIKMWWHQY